MKIVHSTVVVQSGIDWLSRLSLKLFAVVVVVYLILVPFFLGIHKFSNSIGVKFFFFIWFSLLFICKLREQRASKKDFDWMTVLIFFILYFAILS